MAKRIGKAFIIIIFLFITVIFLVLQSPDTYGLEIKDCVPVPEGIVSWWPGDGDALDVKGNNNGAVGSGTTYSDGYVNKAFSFDGTEGYIKILDESPGVPLDGFSELTIDAWIKPNSLGWDNPETGGNTAAILSKYDSSKENGVSFSFQIENGKFRFVILESLAPIKKIGFLSSDVVPLNTWSHIAAVWHGGQDIKIYLNGQEIIGSVISEGPIPTKTAENDVPTNIGRIESFSGSHTGPAGYFAGQIDEIDIFDRGLSNSEIQDIYNSGSAGKCTDTLPAPTPSATPFPKNFMPLVKKDPTRTPTSPNPVDNGDFESGPVSWKQYSSNGWDLIVHADYLPVRPLSGTWAAWLGGDDNEDAVLWQVVQVPSNDPILKYWLWIASEDLCGYDVAGVVINLDEIVDAYWLCIENETGKWVERNVDLSVYAGQNVELDFAAFTDETLNSNLFIDDVSLGKDSINFGVKKKTQIIDPDFPINEKPSALLKNSSHQQDNEPSNDQLDSLSKAMNIKLFVED